jgi:AAHS family 4-hydroxybenzoate transporter-like MFS transporter
MTRQSFVLLLACFACAILDGYDVQVIAYAIPEMARTWNVPLSAFGLVFSAGLFGLVAGSLFLAPLADRHGRRIVVVLAALGAAAATLGNALISNIEWLIVCRVFVGIAIGILTALVVAIAFEAAPQRHRALAVSIVATGFSLGNMASGMIASVVIPRYGWEALFFGASAFAVLVAFLFFISSFETPRAPAAARVEQRGAIRTLVSTEYRSLTLTMWLLHFGGVGAMYVLLSWLPSLLTRSGYPTSEAAFTTSLISVGGLFGGIAAGYLLSRFGLKWLIACYAMAFSLIALLPLSFHTDFLPIMNIGIGVFMIGGYVCNNIVASAEYPVHLRASGVGWAQGVGRTGSIVSPLLVSLALGVNAADATILLIAAVFPFLSGSATFLLMRRLRAPQASGGGSELA